MKKSDVEEYIKNLNVTMKLDDECKNTAKVYVFAEFDEYEYASETTEFDLTIIGDAQNFLTFLKLYATHKKELFEDHSIEKFYDNIEEWFMNLNNIISIPYYDYNICHTILEIKITYYDENGTAYNIV